MLPFYGYLKSFRPNINQSNDQLWNLFKPSLNNWHTLNRYVYAKHVYAKHVMQTIDDEVKECNKSKCNL